jgi:hypothetical protein
MMKMLWMILAVVAAACGVATKDMAWSTDALLCALLSYAAYLTEKK